VIRRFIEQDQIRRRDPRGEKHESRPQTLSPAQTFERCFRFIAKPWHALELEIAIRQALRHRNLLMENQTLADLVRVQQQQLSRSERAMIELERRFPGLTQVKRGEDGGIELDLTGIDEADLEP